MQYIIIPTKIFKQADMTLAKRLGLDNPRKSVDGSEVVMHIESFERLFGQNGSKLRKTRQRVSYPVYESGSYELEELLASEAWSIPDEELAKGYSDYD